MTTLRVTAYAHTDVGQVRTQNQDQCLIADLTAKHQSREKLDHNIGSSGSLFVVADGVGGARKGDIASRLAVDALYEALIQREAAPTPDAFAQNLEEAVQQAHQTVCTYAATHEIPQMGTTLTAGGIWENYLFTAQVGDSRAYILRDGDLVQITRDQSLVYTLLQEGYITPAEARTHPKKNIILQSIGQPGVLEVVITQHQLQDGDTVLLCSDGLHGMVEHSHIEEILLHTSSAAQSVAHLIERSNAEGGKDNIAVLVVRLHAS
ncbi:PP2C family protein-serine/threonine phosphatase [Anthocerotibacter panamensis]|uniref:PP2C family protein-serine/threonine phosphatase n=1 Tax=Anthocerotibacter panamensis TaxID=2857077 RepID=UPI001C402200|nr:protein phosphatase 2C domain-containing protein [Anthocerotibacter panamensis]